MDKIKVDTTHPPRSPTALNMYRCKNQFYYGQQYILSDNDMFYAVCFSLLNELHKLNFSKFNRSENCLCFSIL